MPKVYHNKLHQPRESANTQSSHVLVQMPATKVPCCEVSARKLHNMFRMTHLCCRAGHSNKVKYTCFLISMELYIYVVKRPAKSVPCMLRTNTHPYFADHALGTAMLTAPDLGCF